MRLLGAFVLVVAASAETASAQAPDARWAPWLGCWQMIDERVSEERSLDADKPLDERRRRPSDVEVCVTRAPEPAGAIMTTRVAGEAALEQSVMADGVSHPLVQSDCRGIQSATWSRDGRRLFASAELTCGEDRRKVSGLSMLEDPLTWLDIQSIEVGDRTEVRLRRYTRPAQAQPGGSSTPAGPLGRAVWRVDDVIEAAARLTPAVLEAALVETHAQVGLNSRALVALDDAGVSDAVIDLLVALAYPDKFQVESQARADRGTFFFTETDIEQPWEPWFYSPLFSRAYYAPFGYFYAPYYAFAPFVTLQPAVVVIDGERPKAMAISPDGTKLYVAIFESGNGSTILVGVRVEPDGVFRIVFCPVARIFTLVPPMSTTSTRMARDAVAVGVVPEYVGRRKVTIERIPTIPYGRTRLCLILC
jgi:hypothetical protein